MTQPSPPLQARVVTDLTPVTNVSEVITRRIPLQYRKHMLLYFSSLHLWAVTSTFINFCKIGCTCLVAIWMFAKHYSKPVAFWINLEKKVGTDYPSWTKYSYCNCCHMVSATGTLFHGALQGHFPTFWRHDKKTKILGKWKREPHGLLA